MELDVPGQWCTFVLWWGHRRNVNISCPPQKEHRYGQNQPPCLAPRQSRTAQARAVLGSYPVHVKFHLEDLVSELQAVTKDVSIGGLLIETASPIPQRCPVDFIMKQHGGPVTRPIQVMGEGEVVRVEPHGLDAGFAIAIKCKRELQLNLPELAS